jgi:hypothetical protein
VFQKKTTVLVTLFLSFGFLAPLSLKAMGFPKKDPTTEATVENQPDTKNAFHMDALVAAIEKLEEQKVTLLKKKEYCDRKAKRLLTEDKVGCDQVLKYAQSFEAHANQMQMEIDRLKSKKAELESRYAR